jgi:thioredoxin 1
LITAFKEEDMVIEVSDRSFETEVIKCSIPVIVDFWAPWCGPCRMIAPVTEKLSEEYIDRVKFCKINVDENPEMSRKYQAMNIPLLLFFKGGKQVESVLGEVPESIIQPKIKALL